MVFWCGEAYLLQILDKNGLEQMSGIFSHRRAHHMQRYDNQYRPEDRLLKQPTG